MALGLRKAEPDERDERMLRDASVDQLNQLVAERDEEINRLLIALEGETERLRHDVYIAWAKTRKNDPGVPSVMLLGFVSKTSANSTKSVMQRGYVRVPPRVGDEVFVHDNGKQYVKLATADGIFKIDRLETTLPDGRVIHFLEGTYTEEDSA